jgi:hypothetical protein
VTAGALSRLVARDPDGEPVGTRFAHIAGLAPGERLWFEHAVVINSEVRTTGSGSKRTYEVTVLYEYEVAGRGYRSTWYRFLTGSSAGHDGKAAIVARLPLERGPPAT